MRLPIVLGLTSCLTLMILACSGSSESDGATPGQPEVEAGADGRAPAPEPDAGVTTAPEPAPARGTSRGAFVLESATGNADTSALTSQSGTVFQAGPLLDITMRNGERSVTLFVKLPIRVGTRSLDNNHNGIVYRQETQQSWTAQTPAAGTVEITRVNGKSFAFTLEARMTPATFSGTTSTGEVGITGSGEATSE